MRVVTIVGPSKAGKTTLLDMLVADSARREFASSPELLDLDVRLGSNHRSDVPRAIDLVRSHAKSGGSFW
jgi:molybdopterin-guanine dinucleotide biosynthesis protein